MLDTKDTLFAPLDRACPACGSAEGLLSEGELCDGDGCWALLHSACWEHAGGCPECGDEPSVAAPGGIRVLGGRPAQVCGYCHADELERARPCPGCGIVLHDPCWLEADRCPSPGCDHSVSRRPRTPAPAVPSLRVGPLQSPRPRARRPVVTEPGGESLAGLLAIVALWPGPLSGMVYAAAHLPARLDLDRSAPYFLVHSALGWLLWFLASWAAVVAFRRLRKRYARGGAA